jgi:hypothetical protein
MGPPVSQTEAFLERVPVGTPLTENLSSVRPAIAWDGDRLWLVAEQNGELKYRVRDDGIWSGWSSLAPNNITPVGGAAVIADASGVWIYARDAAGRVWEKSLGSATDCAPGSCVWGAWAGLANTVTTDKDVAATLAGGRRYVAVRNQSNQKVYATYWNGTSWVSWFTLASQTTDAAPSMTYHAGEDRVWVAIRQPGSPVQLKAIRIHNASPGSWSSIGGTPPVSWGFAPTMVFDGTAVRVIAHDGTFPNAAWQIANDGSGWSSWRKLLSGSGATSQAAAADVNGEVELVTMWFTSGMAETSLP